VPSRRSADRGRLGPADDRQQRRDLLQPAEILLQGADWYKGLSLGRSTDGGTKIYGVSGA